MMAMRVLCAVVVAMMASAGCRRRSSSSESHRSQPSLDGAATRDAAFGTAGAEVTLTKDGSVDINDPAVARFVGYLASFGMRVARSPEDDVLTKRVTEYMQKKHIEVPSRRIFVLSKKAGHIVVSVIDTDAIARKPRSDVSVTFHVSNDSEMRVLFQEPNI